MQKRKKDSACHSGAHSTLWEPQGPSPQQPTEKDPVFFITSAQHAQTTGSESSDLAIWQSDRESVRGEEDHHDFRIVSIVSIVSIVRIVRYKLGARCKLT